MQGAGGWKNFEPEPNQLIHAAHKDGVSARVPHVWFNHKPDQGLTRDEYTVDWRNNVQTSKSQKTRDVRLVAFPTEDLAELSPERFQ